MAPAKKNTAIGGRGLHRVAPATRGAIRRRLAAWYENARRDLPWRQTRDPYAIWVSEVMLQQTQVKTVLPYYTAFMRRFPDITALARARRQTLLKAWEGLGYYSRARNLHRSAQMVAHEMQGRLPVTWDALRRLPGIGDYIAAAVLSIAHDAPYAVVDGNVKRVLARLFRLEQPVNQASGHQIFQNLADQILERKQPGNHNQAMMELGALICTPRRPDCPNCPVSGICKVHLAGLEDQFPKRVQKGALPQRHWVAAAIMKNGRLLLTRRPDNGLLGGLWEFPSAEIGPGDDGAEACARQIGGMLNLKVTAVRIVATIGHTYTHFKLRMTLYLCSWRSGVVHLNGPAAYKWMRPAEIDTMPLHGAMHKAKARLEEIL